MIIVAQRTTRADFQGRCLTFNAYAIEPTASLNARLVADLNETRAIQSEGMHHDCPSAQFFERDLFHQPKDLNSKFTEE